MVRLQNEISDAVRFQHDIPDRLDRPVTAPVTVPENPISNDFVNSRPRSAPLPWMTAIMDRVNALWNAMYDKRPVVAPALDLAYPKMSAEAREEIACDRFTDALGDPDFALKVKESS